MQTKKKASTRAVTGNNRNAKAVAARRKERNQGFHEAIARLKEQGKAISVSSVTREANVSNALLYTSYPEVVKKIKAEAKASGSPVKTGARRVAPVVAKNGGGRVLGSFGKKDPVALLKSENAKLREERRVLKATQGKAPMAAKSTRR